MKLFYNKFFWIVDYNVPLTGGIFSFVEKSFLDKVSVLSIVVLYFKFVACAYLGVTTNFKCNLVALKFELELESIV